MFSMTNLNPQPTLVQSRVILFLHHIALLWSATINNSGSINIALVRSEDFLPEPLQLVGTWQTRTSTNGPICFSLSGLWNESAR